MWMDEFNDKGAWLTEVADFAEHFIMSEGLGPGSSSPLMIEPPADDSTPSSLDDTTLLAGLDTSHPALEDLDILLESGSGNDVISYLQPTEVEDSLKSIEHEDASKPPAPAVTTTTTYFELTTATVVSDAQRQREFKRELSHDEQLNYSDISRPNTPLYPRQSFQVEPGFVFSDSSNGYPPSSDSRGPTPIQEVAQISFPNRKLSSEEISVPVVKSRKVAESSWRASSTSTVSDGTEKDEDIKKPRLLLRDKIKRRRIARGESEVPDDDDDDEIPSQGGLTEADRQRMERRRASNRRAAAKCRIKKKIEAETREQELQQSEEQKKAIEDERDELRQRVSELEDALRQYQRCSSCLLFNSLPHSPAAASLPHHTASTGTRASTSLSITTTTSDSSVTDAQGTVAPLGPDFIPLQSTEIIREFPITCVEPPMDNVMSPTAVVSPDSTTITHNSELLHDIECIISEDSL